ncbi:MAG: hypothetical protein V1712_00085 [Patescibacteria group bacterium]
MKYIAVFTKAVGGLLWTVIMITLGLVISFGLFWHFRTGNKNFVVT